MRSVGVVTLPTVINEECASHGNMGWDWIEGPSSLFLTMNLIKRVRTDETKDLDFRIDAINILNHPNFENPVLNINSPSFGLITGASGNREFVLNARLNF